MSEPTGAEFDRGVHELITGNAMLRKKLRERDAEIERLKAVAQESLLREASDRAFHLDEVKRLKSERTDAINAWMQQRELNERQAEESNRLTGQRDAGIQVQEAMVMEIENLKEKNEGLHNLLLVVDPKYKTLWERTQG